MRNWIKRMLCRHYNGTLLGWYWMEDGKTVVREYQCYDCGKRITVISDGWEAVQWGELMRGFKQL